MKEREVLGLSQDELAERMGIPLDVLQLLESGGVDPRFSTVRRWTGALHISLLARSSKVGKGKRRYTNFR